MNYQIIFYYSSRTGEIEHLLSDELEKLGLRLGRSRCAVSPDELTKGLSDVLKSNRLLFCIGSSDNDESCLNILEKRLSASKGIRMGSDDIDENPGKGKIFTAGNQMIVFLPGDPEKIREALPALKKKLCSSFNLKEATEPEAPPIEKTAGELDKQLSSVNRIRTEIPGLTAEKRFSDSQNVILGIMITLLVVSVILLGSGLYILLT